jgi:peptidoglycan/LPS O-acetylase OafA/YrhL
VYGGRKAVAFQRLVPEQMARNNFDFLRVFMALVVVWSHSFAIYYGSEDDEPISLILNGVYNFGNIAVRSFFVISGFLISQSFARSSSFSSYMSKRVRRIFPGYIVCVLLCSFLVIPAFSESARLDLWSALKAITGAFILHPIYPESDVFASHHVAAVNGSLWSINFEFWCYVGVALIGIIGMVRSRLLIVLAVPMLILVKSIFDFFGIVPGIPLFDDIFGWSYVWTDIAQYFLCGMIVNLYGDQLPRNRKFLAVGVVAFLTLAYVAPILAKALFPFILTYAIFYMAFSRLEFPKLKYGGFSYGTYLYAFPIQQMLIDANLPFWAYVPVATVLSVLAGIASWLLVERHFLSRKNASPRHSPDSEGLLRV